jgi:hypothetical protein
MPFRNHLESNLIRESSQESRTQLTIPKRSLMIPSCNSVERPQSPTHKCFDQHCIDNLPTNSTFCNDTHIEYNLHDRDHYRNPKTEQDNSNTNIQTSFIVIMIINKPSLPCLTLSLPPSSSSLAPSPLLYHHLTTPMDSVHSVPFHQSSLPFQQQLYPSLYFWCIHHS